MKVHVQGSGQTLDLTQKDYLASGGEGSVYIRGQTAYKVYHDSSKMIPTGKFTELSQITDPRVIRPRDLLVDSKGKPIGYTMRFVDGGYPLCQLFPRAFREREGVTPEVVLGLVTKLQESIHNVHQSGVLIVDCNEMNFLVAPDFQDVFCIDADSYQTPHYPATAIMESIRDWSVQGHNWTPLSDWYSFGILSFQMFIGLHPFRGKYHGAKAEFRGKLPTDAADDAFAVTRRRMQAGISVLHPEVGVPGSAYPLTAIPREYLQWYEALFQGKRCPPPSKAGLVGIVLMTPTATVSGTLVEITDLWGFLATVTGVYSSPVPGGNPVISTTDKVYLGNSLVPVPFGQVTVCGFTPRGGRAVVGQLQGTRLSLYNLTDRAPIAFDLAVQEVSCYAGRIYVRTYEHIHEIVLTDMGSQVLASTKPVANVMPHATKLFPGVAIQSLLGSVFVSLLGEPGASTQVRMPDLDGCRTVAAKYDRNVLMVLTEKGGKYARKVFRFEGDTYDVRVVDSVPGSLNFVTLDTGVCVCLNEDEKLELFSNRKGSTSLKVVEDKALTGDLTLAKHEGTLVAYQGTKVHKLRMK